MEPEEGDAQDDDGALLDCCLMILVEDFLPVDVSTIFCFTSLNKSIIRQLTDVVVGIVCK